MKVFSSVWGMKYSVLCVSLLAAGQIAERLSHWSALVVGGTDCNAQANFTTRMCPDDPNSNRTCSQTYDECNQGSGNATRICQVEGGAVNSCFSSGCLDRKDDALSQSDALGAPCVPNNI